MKKFTLVLLLLVSFAACAQAQTAKHAVTTVKADYSVQAGDEFLKLAAGGIRVTLPDARTVAGQRFTFKRVDQGFGTTVVAARPGQSIDDRKFYYLANQWQSVTVFSDGFNWLVEAQYP